MVVPQGIQLLGLFLLVDQPFGVWAHPDVAGGLVLDDLLHDVREGVLVDAALNGETIEGHFECHSDWISDNHVEFLKSVDVVGLVIFELPDLLNALGGGKEIKKMLILHLAGEVEVRVIENKHIDHAHKLGQTIFNP